MQHFFYVSITLLLMRSHISWDLMRSLNIYLKLWNNDYVVRLCISLFFFFFISIGGKNTLQTSQFLISLSDDHCTEDSMNSNDNFGEANALNFSFIQLLNAMWLMGSFKSSRYRNAQSVRHSSILENGSNYQLSRCFIMVALFWDFRKAKLSRQAS